MLSYLFSGNDKYAMGSQRATSSADSWIRTALLFVFLLIYAYFLYTITTHIRRISESAADMMDRISEVAEPSILGSIISAIIHAAT